MNFSLNATRDEPSSIKTNMAIQVKKRNGALEPFDNEKINKVVEWATKDISGVNASDVIMKAKLYIADGVATSDLHESLISAAEDLITIDTPNYDKVACNLLNYKLRKIVWGGKNAPKLIDFMRQMVNADLWHKSLLDSYTEKEINKIDEYLDHGRDFLFTYGGLTQLVAKYFIQNRKTKQLYETPQFAIIGMAMAIFAEEKTDRLSWIKNFYDETSKHMSINWPTPILSGARTRSRSYSSCCLVSVLDTKESLFAANTAAGMVTCDKYGLGLDLSRLRPINAPIKNGETLHTGVVAWLKIFQDTVRCCQQGGARRGAGTTTFPIFHPEIMTILVLKNNQGTHENRVPHLDYSITLSQIFWDRLVSKEDISLFSSVDAPELYDKFGTEDFNAAYLACEKNTKIPRIVVSAKDLFTTLFTERLETARIYLVNVDLANRFSPWNDVVQMSNLCQEILHPVIPERFTNDPDAEIGVCVLAATNMLKIKNDEHHRKVCKLIVKVLNNIIDMQSYSVKGCENFAKNKRSLGVGISNFSAWLAAREMNHNSPEALEPVNQFMEKQQYYLMEASMELAKTDGPAPHFEKSKYYNAEYSPVDLYCKSVDGLVQSHHLDWSGLMADIKKHGMRNMTVSAIMPCESSSVIQNSTNGIEPITSFIIKKSSLEKTVTQIVPCLNNKKHYLKKGDIASNDGIIKINAVAGKWLDMASSFNMYYNSDLQPNGVVSLTTMIRDHLMATHYGLKTFYYCNSKKKKDSNADVDLEPTTGCVGGCSL